MYAFWHVADLRQQHDLWPRIASKGQTMVGRDQISKWLVVLHIMPNLTEWFLTAQLATACILEGDATCWPMEQFKQFCLNNRNNLWYKLLWLGVRFGLAFCGIQVWFPMVEAAYLYLLSRWIPHPLLLQWIVYVKHMTAHNTWKQNFIKEISGQLANTNVDCFHCWVHFIVELLYVTLHCNANVLFSVASSWRHRNVTSVGH